MWTDGRNGWTDVWTHRQCQNYIPPTSSGDNKKAEHQQGIQREKGYKKTDQQQEYKEKRGTSRQSRSREYIDKRETKIEQQ